MAHHPHVFVGEGSFEFSCQLLCQGVPMSGGQVFVTHPRSPHTAHHGDHGQQLSLAQLVHS